MTEREKSISDMQCRVFRMAQRKWGMSPEACARLFKEHDLLGYIEDCYEGLHLNSYACALDELEELLQREGVQP